MLVTVYYDIKLHDMNTLGMYFRYINRVSILGFVVQLVDLQSLCPTPDLCNDGDDDDDDGVWYFLTF